MNASRIRFFETLHNEGKTIPELRHFYNYVISGGKQIRKKRKAGLIQNPTKKQKANAQIHILNAVQREHDTLLSSLSSEESSKEPEEIETPINTQRKENDDDEDDEEDEEEEQEEEDEEDEDDDDEEEEEEDNEEDEDDEDDEDEEEDEDDEEDEDEDDENDEEQEEEEEKDKDDCEKDINKGSVDAFMEKLDNCLMKKLAPKQSSEDIKNKEDDKDNESHISNSSEGIEVIKDKSSRSEKERLLEKIKLLEQKLKTKK